MSTHIMPLDQVKEYYREIQRHPTVIGELSEYQKSKILAFAKQAHSVASRQINEIQETNHTHEAPQKSHVSEEDYARWLGAVSNYYEAEQVLNAFKNYNTLNKPPEFKSESTTSMSQTIHVMQTLIELVLFQFNHYINLTC